MIFSNISWLAIIIYSCTILWIGFYMGRHCGLAVWNFFRWLRVNIKRYRRFEKRKNKGISIQK